MPRVGSALSADGEHWLSAKGNFLIPVKALSILFRAKFRDALKKAELFELVPTKVWQQDWITHCKPVGKGEGALKYLAPYIFRVAISNRRIVKVDEGRVPFRYRESDTGTWRTCTLTAEEFLRRFLQHVLPKGFVKVRYYGLFSPSRRHILPLLRLWLGADDFHDEVEPADAAPNTSPDIVTCPTCGHTMRWIQKVRPRGRCPPLVG